MAMSEQKSPSRSERRAQDRKKKGGCPVRVTVNMGGRNVPMRR
jgi:hypothetical protein